MKKIYSNPTLVVVKVATLQMLAASETVNMKGNYGDGNGIVLGGRQGIFDEDEE